MDHLDIFATFAPFAFDVAFVSPRLQPVPHDELIQAL
jgi:hypothetical protein